MLTFPRDPELSSLCTDLPLASRLPGLAQTAGQSALSMPLALLAVYVRWFLLSDLNSRQQQQRLPA